MVNNTTGCKYLDDQLGQKGLSYSTMDSPEIASICTETCPHEECIINNREDDGMPIKLPKKRDVYLQCPDCLETETLTMYGKKLEKHWRWIQLGDGEIRHLHMASRNAKILSSL